MAHFEDLPLEILPLILQHIIRPSHLASLCLVNNLFYIFVIPQLYERAFIYAWQKKGKEKVVKLFKTLADYPALAAHVRRLGHVMIQRAQGLSCSTALQSSAHENVLDICLKGIKNCTNLESCTWTRDGSLTSSVLETLLLCPHLDDLEINGSHQGHYDPLILPQFDHLRRISLIMPSSAVVQILPAWMQSTGRTLRHLSLICKSSVVVTDTLLETLAPNLSKLEHLYIVGCRKVTERGVHAVLTANENGIQGLGLEGVSRNFDMAHFSQQCTHTDSLSSLHSVTLAVHIVASQADASMLAHEAAHDNRQPLNTLTTTALSASARDPHSWETDVLALLAPAALEQFHISTVGGEIGPVLSDTFCAKVASVHGERLRRFSVHRMRMNLQAIASICQHCPQLEQLFVVVDQDSLDALGPCLALAHKLRTVHVNRSLLRSGDAPVVSRERILSIVRQCPSTVMQFGSNTKVYQVERIAIVKDDGNVTIDVRLGPYESPEVPEQFLVART